MHSPIKILTGSSPAPASKAESLRERRGLPRSLFPCRPMEMNALLPVFVKASDATRAKLFGALAGSPSLTSLRPDLSATISDIEGAVAGLLAQIDKGRASPASRLDELEKGFADADAKRGHQVFHTGMKDGEAIPVLVGWEWHGDPAKIPGLEIVASGPTQSAPGKPNGGEYTATVYPGAKGNLVFNAATIWWADGLSEPPGYIRPSVYTTPQGPDPRVARITSNVLDRMRASSVRGTD